MKLVGGGSITLIAGCIGDSNDDAHHLQIHTAAEGGDYYNFSAPLVELLAEHSDDPKLEATVSTSDGSIQNIRMLNERETDIGASVDQVLFLADNGAGPFEEEIDLRVIMRASITPQFFVVRDDSDIHSIEDLNGKTVTAGPAGSGTLGQYQQLEDQFDIDAETQNLDHGEGGNALIDGDVDAWWIFFGADVQNIFATQGDDLRILEFSDAELDGISEVFPWTTDVELTPEMLSELDEPKRTMGSNNYWITYPEYDNDVISEFCRVTIEHAEAIREANPASGDFGFDFAFHDAVLPYHDGASQYRDEQD